MSALIHPALTALAWLLIVVTGLWAISVIKRDASIIDTAWSLLQLGAAGLYAHALSAFDARSWLCLLLVTAWALRLSVFITWRNWGEPEDRRYQQIRARNAPNYAGKSLYLVFWLQGTLAWLVSLPLLPALANASPLNMIDFAGAALFIGGLLFESIGDAQLAHFKRDPGNRDRVMDRGLWRYTRHPNYFGEFCCSWGIYLIAVGSGGWWTIFAPLLMSYLLLRVSGVALLEQDIAERRPKYRDYIERTNAFFPSPARSRS